MALPNFAELITNPQGVAQLRKGRGANSDLVLFLAPFAMRNFIYLPYEFHEATISPDFVVSNSGGTSAADFAVNSGVEGGTYKGDTGTDDDGSVQINYESVMFDAARNPGFEIALKSDAVTSYAVEMSMCDEPTTAYTLNDSALSAAAVPTEAANGVTDRASIIINTDFTLATAALCAVGTTDSTEAGIALGGFVHTAATFAVWRLQVGNRKAFAIINDNYGQVGRLGVGPDTGVLMRPHVIVATKNTTAKFPEIDYFRIWSERAY
jgi:hypothetical protein